VFTYPPLPAQTTDKIFKTNAETLRRSRKLIGRPPSTAYTYIDIGTLDDYFLSERQPSAQSPRMTAIPTTVFCCAIQTARPPTQMKKIIPLGRNVMWSGKPYYEICYPGNRISFNRSLVYI